jgi:hypothetical protein
MLIHSEEEYLNHQAVIDSLYKGHISNDTRKVDERGPEHHFRDMTTAGIVNLVRALAAQNRPGPSLSLKVVGNTKCTHSHMNHRRQEDGSLGPRLFPGSTVALNRLDLLASTAGTMKEFQTIRRCSLLKCSTNVKHTLSCTGSRQSRPRPMGPPPRLPSLKSWQTVRKPSRAQQVANLKIACSKKGPAVVEPEYR